MIIQLYSTPSCGKCMLVKSTLEDKVSYKMIDDIDKVREKSSELGLLSMPILIVDNIPYSGRGAVIKANEIVKELNA